MMGRYGMDAFGHFLSIVAMVFLALDLLGIPMGALFALGLLVYACYRAFSRNISQRSAENQQYLQIKKQIQHWFSTRKQRFLMRNTYRYIRCPGCGQSLRVPRGKGEIIVTCPHCHTRSEQKS